MASDRNRRFTPKGILEKMAKKKIETNLMPAVHKVQILEYFLSCPVNELERYRGPDVPNFINESVKMLLDGKLCDYLNILNQCRQMAREDALNAK